MALSGSICAYCMKSNAERLDYERRGLAWDIHEHLQRHKRQCETNHFDISDGEVCHRCGQIIKRDELGREINAPEAA